MKEMEIYSPSGSPKTSTVLLCLGSRTGDRDPRKIRAPVLGGAGYTETNSLNREQPL